MIGCENKRCFFNNCGICENEKRVAELKSNDLAYTDQETCHLAENNSYSHDDMCEADYLMF